MEKLPILITRGNYIFPKERNHLEFGRSGSVKTIEYALENNIEQILLLSQKNPTEEEININDIYTTGVLARFEKRKQWKDGTVSINIESLERVKVKNIKANKDDIIFGNYEILKPINYDTNGNDELFNYIFNEIKQVFKKGDIDLPYDTNSIMDKMQNSSSKDINYLVDSLCSMFPFVHIKYLQKMIEELDPRKRFDILLSFLNEKTLNIEIENELNKKIKNNTDEQQKEFFLREKLKAIKESLDDISGEKDDLAKYKEQLESNPYPENIKKRILSEISRMETMHSSSSEANILKSYIDWIMWLPWYELDDDSKIDLRNARKILDDYHYGLDKVKERIVEYLAVKQNSKSNKGQIITLVGPPGVGKTSLAKSIAEAMGRKFVKISLGGVKDEAEIRGHRRTYIGAMPGKIIQAMKKAKVKNPVFLLDEIDKMSSDHRGDPASAMLEVLDPEQNSAFVDNYIEEEYDLSNVVFIATANYVGNIPEALIDRMDLIELSSYTEIEKLQIAKRHLVKKILTEYNISEKELQFTDKAIEEIIKHYTREAGVRQLERHLFSIARKFIVKKLNDEVKSMKVDTKDIESFLKKRIFEHTEKNGQSQVGVVTGLAYTQFGGDILPIEVTHFKGNGQLILTGKLGEVMKESASIAYDYIKSNAKTFNIHPEIFKQNNIHLHVPEGAVPKDGPSAGITLTTAIISALTNRPVSKEIGMTGEITLRGLVLPIGGLKEKLISANRSGLSKILIPYKNIKDLDDIPKEVKDNLEIIPVKTYDEVYAIVFGEKLNILESEAPTFDVKLVANDTSKFIENNI